jgi:hypothetical protein
MVVKLQGKSKIVRATFKPQRQKERKVKRLSWLVEPPANSLSSLEDCGYRIGTIVG